MRTKLFLFVANIACYFSFGQNYFNDGYKEYMYGDLNHSVMLFTKAINNNEEVVKSYMYRGAAKAFLNKFNDALSDLNFALKMDSTNYKIYYYFGKTYLLNGFDNIALKYFNKAILLNPKDADSYDNSAIVKGKIGDYSGAILDENKAIALDQTKQDYFNNRGFNKLQLKQYKEAIDDFSASIKIKPTQRAYSNRGLAYSNINMHEKAIEDYSNSLQMLPDDKIVFFYRALSFKALGKKTEACSDLDKSIKLGYPQANVESKTYCSSTK